MGSGPFPSTRASILERLRAPDTEPRRAAFDVLATAYGPPVHVYLCRRWRMDAESARDASQGFFAAAFEKQWFERFDANAARFRTFLRVCLDRHVMNLRQGEARHKRGGGAAHVALDDPGVEAAATVEGEADRIFHDEFVRALFTRAVEATRRQCEASGQAGHFALFERCDLADDERHSYAALAAEAGLSVSQVTNRLALVRRRLRDAVLMALRDIAVNDEEYREDARALLGVEIE